MGYTPCLAWMLQTSPVTSLMRSSSDWDGMDNTMSTLKETVSATGAATVGVGVVEDEAAGVDVVDEVDVVDADTTVTIMEEGQWQPWSHGLQLLNLPQAGQRMT